jgi:TPR repeat protein
MDDKASPGLQHIPTGATLSLHSTRSGIIARGRRDAANAASNPHYKQAVADYNSGNFTAAAQNFQLAAEQGHAESQYLLSTLYDEGRGLPQDTVQAEHWERRAADQGHAYAQANLSFRHYSAGNFDEAFAWCQRAAYANLPWAQYNLGLMYRKGEGVPQSNTDAGYWYRLAAAQNFPEAQQKLADLYYLASAFPSITPKPPSGIAAPPSRATPKPSSSSPTSTPRDKASNPTTRSPATGSAKPPSKATNKPNANSNAANTATRRRVSP